uniref:Uncharacterized protein n=1 Tax=Opuntia streptacantha TaxID=393608 RepID=A0A7C9D7I2_OPUST
MRCGVRRSRNIAGNLLSEGGRPTDSNVPAFRRNSNAPSCSSVLTKVKTTCIQDKNQPVCALPASHNFSILASDVLQEGPLAIYQSQHSDSAESKTNSTMNDNGRIRE